MSHTVIEYPHPIFQGEPVRRRRPWSVWLVAVVAVAALAVALVSLLRGPTTAPAANQHVSQTDDRQLCETAGPLLKESLDIGNRFTALGHTGTPARDAGIPAFRDEVLAWQDRIQKVIDANTGQPDFLVRQVQIYSDQFVLYSMGVRPGEATSYDNLAWAEGSVALSGPMAVCGGYGLEWWK